MRYLMLATLLMGLCGALSADAPSHETWSFEREWSLQNLPVKNAFTIKSSGKRVLHRAEKDRPVLLELADNASKLTKVQLKGMPLPVEILPATMRDFKLARAFTLLSTARLNQRLAEASVQLYVDGRIFEALARLCQQDWRAIKELARGQIFVEDGPGFEWSAPAIYPMLRYQEEAVSKTQSRITITGSGFARAGGSGRRQLKSWRFVGLRNRHGGRFVKISISGKLINIDKQIHTQLSETRKLVKAQPVSDAPRYLQDLAQIAQAVGRRNQRQLAAAYQIYREQLSSAVTPALAETVKAYFGEIKQRLDSVAWIHDDLTRALAESKKQGKPVMVLFEQDG